MFKTVAADGGADSDHCQSATNRTYDSALHPEVKKKTKKTIASDFCVVFVLCQNAQFHWRIALQNNTMQMSRNGEAVRNQQRN